MRKLSKKISMLMVLAMLVGLFSGVVSASAASAWSFASSKYDVAVNGSINMESKEYADFDLLKDGAAPAGYTVAWASSDEDVVWVNAKTGQLRANKFGVAEDGDKAVISATFTNTATKKSATRSFTIVLGAAKADFTVEAADATIALGEEVKFAPVVKNADGKAVKFATHKSYNGYFLDGKAIANPWTPEEAGEYTVTIAQFAKKADVADLAKAVRKTDVKVTVTVDAEFDAKATGVKEITVYGDFAKDAKFAVKKGAQNVTFATTVAEDGKSAKLALNNKLTKGTYTVIFGDAKVDLAIEDEKVASIVIAEKGGQIFVEPNQKMETYVHYDVFNQYGESVRKTFDIKWSHNLGDDYTADKANGVLTLESDKVLDYNDMVVLTGVANGVGYAVSETATMTIGLSNNVSTVKVLGVIKKGTSEILDEVPASFIGGQYQLVFEVYDRAGYVMKFDAAEVKKDITFTSMNPLLVSVDDEDNMGEVFIKGVKYGVLDLEPGDQFEQVKKGGVAEIQIISTKTGEPSKYLLRVVSEQILDTFNVLEPDFIIAENDDWGNKTDVALAFEATDVNGAAITDFRALYKAVSFSSDSIQLREQNDGTAKLFYTVNDDVDADKDFDYPVVFTAIVPGSGKSDNVRFSVKDARVASVATGYNGATDVLEGSSLKIFLRDRDTWDRDGGIDYADQYDTKLNSNGLFGNRYVGVKVLGSDDNSLGLRVRTVNADSTLYDGNVTALVDADKRDGYTFFNKNVCHLDAQNIVTPDAKEFTVEYILFDSEKEEFVGGSEIRVTYRVVDISQCVGFTLSPSDGLIQNGATTGSKVNAEGKYEGPERPDYSDFSVRGTLANGNTVAIPDTNTVDGTATIVYTASDYTYAGYGLQDDTNWLFTDIEVTTGNALLFKDQSAKNPDGSLADRKLTYHVSANIYVNDSTAEGGKKLIDVANADVQVGNYDRKMVRINTLGYSTAPFTWSDGNTAAFINATNGIITYEDLMSLIDNKTDNYDDTTYGNKSGIKVSITKLVEGGKGLVPNNIKLKLNSIFDTDIKDANKIVKLDRFGEVVMEEKDTNGDGVKEKVPVKVTPMIENAEIGDTFVVTYTTNDYNANHTINFTVGADQTAWFTDTEDNCPKR